MTYVLRLWLTVTVNDTDIQAYSTGVRMNALSSQVGSGQKTSQQRKLILTKFLKLIGIFEKICFDLINGAWIVFISHFLTVQ